MSDAPEAVIKRFTVVLRCGQPDRALPLALTLAGIAEANGLTAALHTAPGGLVVAVEGEAECVEDVLAGVVPALPGARVDVAHAGPDGRAVTEVVVEVAGREPAVHPVV